MERTGQMEQNALFAARERIVDLDVSYKKDAARFQDLNFF